VNLIGVVIVFYSLIDNDHVTKLNIIRNFWLINTKVCGIFAVSTKAIGLLTLFSLSDCQLCYALLTIHPYKTQVWSLIVN